LTLPNRLWGLFFLQLLPFEYCFWVTWCSYRVRFMTKMNVCKTDRRNDRNITSTLKKVRSSWTTEIGLRRGRKTFEYNCSGKNEIDSPEFLLENKNVVLIQTVVEPTVFFCKSANMNWNLCSNRYWKGWKNLLNYSNYFALNGLRKSCQRNFAMTCLCSFTRNLCDVSNNLEVLNSIGKKVFVLTKRGS